MCIGKACLNVFVGKPRVVTQYFRFRPTLGKKAHDKFDRQTRSFDNGFARQYGWLNNYARFPRHDVSFQ